MNSRDLLESIAISSEGGVQLADLCVPESEAGTERDTEDRAVRGERSTLCGQLSVVAHTVTHPVQPLVCQMYSY